MCSLLQIEEGSLASEGTPALISIKAQQQKREMGDEALQTLTFVNFGRWRVDYSKGKWSTIMTHLTGRIADPTIQPAIHCNEDLPADIRRELPPMIQDIFRNAYNLAKSQEAGGDLAIQSGDERAREKAWGAVRCAYTQIGTTWVLNRAA